MSGRGPAPKAPGQRRRRNAPSRGEWIDLAPLDKPVLPELPALPDGEKWNAPTIALWEAWRFDPVTSQYCPADVAYAVDTIRLRNAMTARTAGEIRLRMDSLGLTPKGKRDLRWRIIDEAPAEEQRPASVRRLRAI